ncbi:Tetratricopeptide repeat protein 35 [Heterocephalus glaber]|uniref:ER membrane protein complex subunit 2 n=1 Tax=Heterocephalus glaber TaxID=10181 RepID=G5BN34_HETGA|nr:Tetratricopeptide repeat protein 35 [Heterocephalus glaber]
MAQPARHSLPPREKADNTECQSHAVIGHAQSRPRDRIASPLSALPAGSGKMAKVSELYDVTWEGNLVWIIYEQVMIAALDYGRDDLALAARKRKIAIRKAQGKSVEAIRELNEYLEQFVGNQEAWHELAELYISEHDYAKAAFCLEELMMTNPHNHLYCQQYAEVKCTQGGLENLELSRKYFAQALKLNNRNMRALFGLYMSASHIASNPKASAKMKKDNMKYAGWAADQINRAYQFAGRSKKETRYSLKAVGDMLETLQITQSSGFRLRHRCHNCTVGTFGL